MAVPNPWLERRIFHWAHQGGAREAPSNTLHAMKRALAAGAHGLELDVHCTRDQRVVMIHDARLERTTNGRGKVADKTLDELRRLDAAFWWVPGEIDNHDPSTAVERYELRGRAPADEDLRIPTLDELLERYPSTPLTIEVKSPAAAEPVVRLLHEHSRSGDVIVTSFKDSTVRTLRRASPELHVAPGPLWSIWFTARARLRVPPRDSPYVALQSPRRFKFVPVLNRRVVAAARRAGMAVHAWTIDEEDEMRELIAMGVDGIMTDRPTVLSKVLETSPS